MYNFIGVYMKFLRIFCVCVLILSCFACSFSGVCTKITKNETENEYSYISTELLEISYKNDSEFANTLNTQFSENLLKRIDSFDKLAKESAPTIPSDSKASFTTTQDIKYNENDFLSVVEQENIFTGGAHGVSARNSYNIDFRNKRQICLNDLFEAEGYENALNRMIDELIQKRGEDYTDLWKKPKIQAEHQYNFYITDTDLVIYFQPYELSYYARGFVEFPLSLSELRGYLKEEYYFLTGDANTNGEDNTSSSPSFI